MLQFNVVVRPSGGGAAVVRWGDGDEYERQRGMSTRDNEGDVILDRGSEEEEEAVVRWFWP